MATIPLSWNDPLFSGVTNSGSVTLRNGGTLSNTSITDSGLIASVVLDDGSTTLDHVRINSEEGVRIGGSGNITISNSYIETTGLAGDHADGIQAYDPGGTGNVTITNTTIVSHDSNATSGMFIADQYSGTFTFNNVVFEGGPYGLRIAADAGAGHDDYVSLTNVYFVGPFEYGAFLFQEVNANIHITQWNNVRYATIVNGVLVPGALIADPTDTSANPTVTPANPTVTSRVERFFDSATGDHFYAASTAEAAQIRATLPTYHDEGAPWSVPAAGPGTQNVYRFFDVVTHAHFFTDSAAERANIDNTPSLAAEYHDEGVAFQEYTAAGPGTFALERFFNTISHMHAYGASAAENASIRSGGAGPGWVDEGTSFIVHT